MIPLIKRNLLKIFYPVAKIIWRITRPRSLGVRVFLLSPSNKILLVEHSYTKYLTPPGGSVAKYEKIKDAAIREVFEEVGIAINKVDLYGVYRNNYEYKDDTLVIVISKVKSEIPPVVDNIEIINSFWVDIYNLPENTHFLARRYIESYIKDPNNINLE